MGIKVVLADDHRLVREGVASLLKREADIQVVGEASNGHEAFTLIERLHPDIAVVDIAMPELNGIETTRQIRSREPRTKVIILSSYDDKRYVLTALETGAAGYVLKDCASEELIHAIRSVYNGRKFLSASIASTVVDSYVGRDFPSETSIASQLGDREREVLQLIAEGRSSPQIAKSLYIATSTVEAHRRNIMKKLDLHTIADLTKFAIREGITTL